MSGGSWDYAYGHIDAIASRLCLEVAPNRRALGKLLTACAKALHDIEWVDSMDYRPGDENDAITKALGEYAPTLILAEVVADAKRAIEQLRALVVTATREVKP